MQALAEVILYQQLWLHHDKHTILAKKFFNTNIAACGQLKLDYILLRWDAKITHLQKCFRPGPRMLSVENRVLWILFVVAYW